MFADASQLLILTIFYGCIWLRFAMYSKRSCIMLIFTDHIYFSFIRSFIRSFVRSFSQSVSQSVSSQSVICDKCAWLYSPGYIFFWLSWWHVHTQNIDQAICTLYRHSVLQETSFRHMPIDNSSWPYLSVCLFHISIECKHTFKQHEHMTPKINTPLPNAYRLP